MRILLPVDGSARANRAVEPALVLADSRADAEIIPVNVQSQETVDISDISGGMSVGADRKLAADQSKKQSAKRFGSADSHSEMGPIAETIDRIARGVKANQIVTETPGFDPLHGLLYRECCHPAAPDRACNHP